MSGNTHKSTINNLGCAISPALKAVALRAVILGTLSLLSCNAYAISREVEDGGGGGGGGTPTPTATATPSVTASPTPTLTPTPDITPSPAPQITPDETPAVTPNPTPKGEADLCPNDALKKAPGACGCGTPDTDVNLNSVVDCNVTAEFAYIAASIHAKLIRLVERPSAKIAAEQKSLRKTIVAMAKSMKVFEANSSLEIQKTAEINLTKITRKAARRARRAARSHDASFKKHRSSAVRDALRVLRSVDDGLAMLKNTTL